MGKIAFVFPGQGAQAVGMGRDAYEQHPASRHIFAQANEKLGWNLTDLIMNGPEEKLKITYNTQPALLTTSISLYEAFKELHMTPDFVAGHSLGEYSALVVAGVMSFEDAVATVYTRGRLMEEAVPQGQGAMAAVLGADRDILRQYCAQITETGRLVELANLNCPGQIVVSGSVEGVQAVIDQKADIGAKRVIPLEVSGPFHSSLMKPAAERFAQTLSSVPMRAANVPVVSNVTAQPVQEPDEIRQLLEQQVYSPVLWEDSVRWMIEQGVDTFIEIGSGSVLTGLIKKIDRNVKTVNIQNLEQIRQLST